MPTPINIQFGRGALPQTVGKPSDFQAMPAVVLTDGTTTAGWTLVNQATAPSISGTLGVVTFGLNAGSNNIGGAARATYTPTSPVTLARRAAVSLEVRWDSTVNDPDVISRYIFVVSDGVRETSATVGGGNENEWQQVVIPVVGLTQVSSVQIRSVSSSAGGSDMTMFAVRNVRIEAVSAAKAAQVATGLAWITDDADVANAGRSVPSDATGELDTRPAHALLTGLDGVRHLREWDVDETGATDMTSVIARAIHELRPGETLRFPARGRFLIRGMVALEGNVGNTIDLNGSVMFDDTRRVPPFNTSQHYVQVRNCSDTTICNGTIVGFRAGDTQSTFTPATASAAFLQTVAGSPTVSASTILLDSNGEGIRFTPNNGGNTNYLGRHFDPASGQLVNRMSVQLSDSAQVANDCRVRLVTASGVEVASRTLTLTATPTFYELTGIGRDLGSALRIEVVKRTATPNTITVGQVRVWGLSWYDSAAEFSVGVSVAEGNSRVVLRDLWVETVGGYGISVQGSVASPTVDTLIERCTTRATATQGITINLATRTVVRDCDALESGRSAFDLEPYASTWLVDGIDISGCTARNPVNYGMAATNWANIVNLNVDGFTVEGAGAGAWIGGGRRASIRGVHVRSGSPALLFIGQNMAIDGIVASRPPALLAATQEANGVTYTAGGNTLSNWIAIDDVLGAVQGPQFLDGTSTIAGGNMKITGATEPVGGSAGSGAARVVGRPAMIGFDVGVHRQRMPNTYRGPAFDRMWFPWGFDAADGVVSTLGLSATSTPSVNLRGIGVSVATSATTATVTFPSKGWAATFTSAVAAGTSPGGTLSPATTYHYAFCPRPHWRHGHIAPDAVTRTVTTGAGQNSVSVGLGGWQDVVNGWALAGFTIYRSTTSATGPWTMRYDVAPTSGWFSVRSDARSFRDLGSTLAWEGIITDREWGYPNMVDGGIASVGTAGSWATIADESGYEPDASYGVLVTPSWATSVHITAKGRSGFTVNFGTAAPTGATFDWFLVR